MKRIDQCVSVYPVFRVKDGKSRDVRNLLQVFIQRSEGEPGTEVFSMAFLGDRLLLRESYSDLAAFKAHLENVRDLIGDLFSMLELESLNIVAPSCAIEELKALLHSAKIAADIYCLEAGFAR